MYQMIVYTFVSDDRLHILMIFNAQPSQSYVPSKGYARVYEPAAQSLAYPTRAHLYFAMVEVEKEIFHF